MRPSGRAVAIRYLLELAVRLQFSFMSMTSSWKDRIRTNVMVSAHRRHYPLPSQNSSPCVRHRSCSPFERNKSSSSIDVYQQLSTIRSSIDQHRFNQVNQTYASHDNREQSRTNNKHTITIVITIADQFGFATRTSACDVFCAAIDPLARWW